MFTRLAKKNKKIDQASWNAVYEAEIIKRIRKRYSIDQELAVHRQRDKKPEEFAKYNAFVEHCKAEVKAMLGGKT